LSNINPAAFTWDASHMNAARGTVCSEMSAYKIQTAGNYPEESMQHSEHGESLKSRNLNI